MKVPDSDWCSYNAGCSQSVYIFIVSMRNTHQIQDTGFCVKLNPKHGGSVMVLNSDQCSHPESNYLLGVDLNKRHTLVYL